MKRYIAILLCALWMLPLFACAQDDAALENRANYATATVSAVGDIYLTDSMLADAKRPDGSYDFSTQFEDVAVALSQAGITLGNFEGNLIGGDFGAEHGSYPDELAEELYKIGFDFLQTANSYSIFNGLSGLESTKAVIERHGMQALGTYINAEDREKNQVAIRDVNGIRFAFVAFTKGVGNLTIPADTQCGVDLLYEDYTSDYSIINEDGIVGVLQKAKESKPDVIIAAVHWGSENHDEISQTQEEIADLMLRNGVDAIIGSHSHLVGKVERREVSFEDGTKKECVIAYDLGDFCAVEAGEQNTSVILNLEFTRNGNQTVISKVGYTPISAVDRGENHADRFGVMVTQTEIELYEGNYYDRVSAQIYEALLADLESIRKKIGLDTEE